MINQPSLTIRASSFAGLFDCAYRWEGIHILGMRNVVGRRAMLGTAIHAGTAAFDIARLNGQAITADEAAGVMVDKLINPEGDFDTKKDTLTAREAEVIGLKLITKYCYDVSPKYDFHSVEMETKPLDIDCGHDVAIRLTGTLDRARIRQQGDQLSIADIKTGYAAVQKGAASIKGHGAQIGTYELLFEHSTGLEINSDAEIIGMSTSGSAEIASGTIKGAKQIITGTEDKPGLLEFAANMFRSGLFYPNSRSMLCSEKFCPRFNLCHFREK